MVNHDLDQVPLNRCFAISGELDLNQGLQTRLSLFCCYMSEEDLVEGNKSWLKKSGCLKSIRNFVLVVETALLPDPPMLWNW